MSLIETLLPATCVGCKRLPKPLCSNCLEELAPDPRLVDRGVRGFSAIDYTPIATRVVNAYKEHGRTALLTQLCEIMDSLELPKDCVLVGLPSSSRATRKRGFVPAELLAERLARRRFLAHSSALTFTRKIADQALLTKSQRETNLYGAMIAKPLSQPVILVDDVITTGSSMREAARAMFATGNQVMGFVTLAETVLKP